VLNAALASVLVSSLLAAPVGRIDSSFPPLQDQRRPDRTLTHASGAPNVVAYSGDGRVVATASTADPAHVVRVHNARTGEEGAEGTPGELRALAGSPAAVVALGFRGSDQVIAVGADRGITAFEAATGKVLRTGKVPGTAPGLSGPVAVGPGASPLIAFVEDDAGAVYDPESGKVIARFALAAPAAPPTGKRSRKPTAPGCVAFRADGKALVASRGGDLQIFDLAAGHRGRSIAIPPGAPVTACALAEGHVAAASGGLRLWSLAEEESPRSLSAPGAGSPFAALAFAPKGDQLGAAFGRTFAVWDVASATALATYVGHTGALQALAFNPNGQKLASGGADKTLRLWTVPLPPLPAADLEKIAAAVPAKASATPKKPRKLLVFWRADAILHKGGVPAANAAIAAMGKRTGAFEAFFSRDYEVFDPKILARFDAIVFNSTAHITLPDEGKQRAFLAWVQKGHGVVGVHAAIDMWKRWPEGAAVVGATFGGHPWHPRGTWSVKLDEPQHPLLRAFAGKPFKMHDEFYELAEPYTRDDRRVLMSLDVSDPATANVTPLHRKDRDFAVSWIKRHGEGRVFYCMFGHIADPFFLPAVQQYYLDGIQYALGDLAVDATPATARR
jgi:type 1 glutamine amidotransferase